QESGAAFDSIAFHVLDHYLGAPGFDWIDGYGRFEKRTAAARGSARGGRAPAADGAARASFPWATYAGTYRDAWYGEVTIREQSGKLTIAFSHTPSLTGTLEHFEHDTFIARWTDRELRADAYVTFAFNPD